MHGPEELSFDEVAEVLSEALGRKVVYVQCKRDEARQNLLAGGLSENVADMLLEMYDAIESGKVRSLQPRWAETTTPTTLAEFARETMLPLIAVPATH